MRLLFACVAVLMLAGAASAQTARVSGRVIDDSRGSAIVGASVRLTGADAVVTDSAGRFRFDPSITGRLILTVSSIGYQFRSIDLIVSADTSVVIRLTQRITALDTMIVRPRYLERVEVYKNGAMVRVYTKKYVASLIAKGLLPKVIYSPIGLGLACH